MIFPRPSFGASFVASALILTACGSESPEVPASDSDGAVDVSTSKPARPQMASAGLKLSDGTDVGTVTATQQGRDILIAVKASGMTAGDHGIHVHTTGKCEGPTFETAGTHWNPGGAQHGLSNPQGQHHGDMPNLTVATDGTARMDYTIKDSSMAEMLDADGAALVIHAKADDQMTDPSGDSGDRVACGVFALG